MAQKQKFGFKFKWFFICVLFFFLGLFFTLLTSFVAKKFFPAAKTPLSSVSEKTVNSIQRLLKKNPALPILIQNRALLSPKPVTIKINDKPLDDIIASFHLMSSSHLLLFSNQRLTRNLSSLSFEITDLPQKRLATWSANQKLIAFDQVFDETTHSVKLMVYLNPDYLATLDLQAQEDLINREIYRGLFFMANWENFQENGRVFEPETIPDLKFVELSKPVSLFQKIFGNFEAAAYCDHGPECGWNRQDCICDKDESVCNDNNKPCGYSKPYGFCHCTEYYCHPNGNLGYCPAAVGGGSCLQGNCGTGGDCPPFFSCNWIPDYVPPNATPTPLGTPAPPPPTLPTDWGKYFIMALIFYEDSNGNGIMDSTEKFINPMNDNPNINNSNNTFIKSNQWENIGNLGYSLNCIGCNGHFQGSNGPLMSLTERVNQQCNLVSTVWSGLRDHLRNLNNYNNDSFTGYTFDSYWLNYPNGQPRLMVHASTGFCGEAQEEVWMPPMIWAVIWDTPPSDFRWRHQVNLTLPSGWIISPNSLTKNSSYLYPNQIGHPFAGTTDVFFRAIGLIRPPNCRIISGTPDEIVLGQTATLNGRFYSPQGNLGAAIQVAYPTPRQSDVKIYRRPTPPTIAEWSTNWTPTTPRRHYKNAKNERPKVSLQERLKASLRPLS